MFRFGPGACEGSWGSERSGLLRALNLPISGAGASLGGEQGSGRGPVLTGPGLPSS